VLPPLATPSTSSRRQFVSCLVSRAGSTNQRGCAATCHRWKAVELQVNFEDELLLMDCALRPKSCRDNYSRKSFRLEAP
jgi:hypothetical protein